MKIIRLKLFTNRLTLEKSFYSETLGFELIEESDLHFTINIGRSELTFEASKISHHYHYCFLIPSNKLEEALVWLEQRVDIIITDDGKKTHWFETWNAESFYFFDKSGNIGEFIVRYDLKNETNSDFDINQVLCVNEIGLPTKQVAEINRLLEEQLNTKFWKGNHKVFGTNGTQEGLFLLVNFKLKANWFPTSIKPTPAPFEAVVENEGNQYFVEFKEEVLKIKT